MRLLRFLRKLAGQPRQSAAAPAKLPPRGEARPATRPGSADTSGHSFVRREAILDRREQVAGYEFSLITQLQERTTRHSGAAARAYDVALLARLELHHAASLLGTRLALICLSIESLDNELIERLPRDNTVLIFDLDGQAVERTGAAAGLAALKDAGFRVGLRIAEPAAADRPLLGAVEFLQVDVSGFNGLDLRALARKLKAEQPSRQLVAGNVQSDDDFQLCHKCGFDLFQGPFTAHPGSPPPTRETINRAAALSILNMVRTDQSFAAIAAELKNEPTLSYKLLRYLNSAAVGLQKPIDSLTEALVVLGRDRFYRWTSLLLFDFEKPGYREQLLSERALARGRTLELLAGKGRVPKLPEQLFMVGLFSLLDQVLGRPLPELVEKAALPDLVRDALLGQPGPCTDALTLVTVAEADAKVPAEIVERALDTCGIDDREFAPRAAEALVWAARVMGGPG